MFVRIIMLSTLVTATLAAAAGAHDVRPPAGDVEVRLVCQAGCDEIRHHGQRYVIGELGQRYGIAVTNRSDRWVEAVVAVDGRDVVDGRHMSPRSRGYLLAPWQSLTIEGWRTSAAEVAAFRFTSIGDSYVGRIGEGRQAGQIRVDVYPERASAPIVVVPRPAPPRRELPEPWLDEDDPRAPKADRQPAPSADRPETEALRPGGKNLGTQYGETRWQPVQERHFERADPNRPARTLVLWYDDYAGLVGRGILPRHGWDGDDGPRWVPPPPPRAEW